MARRLQGKHNATVPFGCARTTPAELTSPWPIAAATAAASSASTLKPFIAHVPSSASRAAGRRHLAAQLFE
jgi:hypothetical protein